MVNRLVSVDDDNNLPLEVQEQLVGPVRVEFEDLTVESQGYANNAATSATAAASSVTTAQGYASDANVARIAAEAAAASATAPTDGQVADLVQDPASETSLALSTGLTTSGTRPVGKGELVLNVKDFGAKGDGVSDDSFWIQSALNVAGGKILFVPDGTYMINGNASGGSVGLRMEQASTRLVLSPGATLKVIPNNRTNYTVLSIRAADCVVTGGTFLGDSGAHLDTVGEWGHLIVVDTGAHRCRVESVVVTRAWGDGIIVQRGPIDVSIINVIAEDNRRQGLSITGSTRTRVVGGLYKDTGKTDWILPCAGIDVEPNPSTEFSVIDCTITGVTLQGNRGEGLLFIRATAVLTSATVSNCVSIGNGVGSSASGFRVGGSAGTMDVKLIGCKSMSNTLHGFDIYAPYVEAIGCTAQTNAGNGFEVTGLYTKLVDPMASHNNGSGIRLFTDGNSSTIVGGVTENNSFSSPGSRANVDIYAQSTRVVGHVSVAGSGTNKPSYGYIIRTGATSRLLACDVLGTFVTGNYLDQVGTTMLPKPGFGSAAAIAPAAATLADLQAKLNLLLTASSSAGIIT